MSATRYVLYYDQFSAPARALYIFMRRIRLPLETRTINLRQGEHLQPEFEKVNPLKTIPVVIDTHRNITMIESISIAKFLCLVYKRNKDLYSADKDNQRFVNEYLDWHHMNTRYPCNSYVLQKVVKPALTGEPVSEKKLASYEERVVKCLDLLENYWLKEKLFLVGSCLTLADLFAACELEQLRIAGLDPRTDRPELASWLKRVSDKLVPFYGQVHGNLEDLGKESVPKIKAEATGD